MQSSKKLSWSVLAALAALALTTPGADAVPMYDGHPPAQDTGATGAYTPDDASGDMHASTTGTTFDTSVTGGDLRSEAAKPQVDPRAGTADVSGPADLRTEATRPTVAAQQPAAVTDGGDDPIDWPLVGLLLAGTIALAGAALVISRHSVGHAH